MRLATVRRGKGPRATAPDADTVDGELCQHASTRQLVFDPPTLLAYISAFTTLRAGVWS